MKCYCCGATVEDGLMICPKCGKLMQVTAELIRRAIEGDMYAHNELYYRTRDAVYGAIRSHVQDDDTALDLMQDTYQRAFTHLEQLREPAAFPGWIITIARNLTKNWNKKCSRHNVVNFSANDYENEENLSADTLEMDQPEVSIGKLPEEALEQAETSRMIREIMDSLPSDQQIVLSMLYIDQMTMKEIANELEIKEGTVKSRLHRAKCNVQKKVQELEKQGIQLYSLAPLPFFVWMLRSLETQNCTFAAEQVVGKAAQAACAARAAAEGAVQMQAPAGGTAQGGNPSAPQYNPQGGNPSAPQYNPQGGYTSWSQYNPQSDPSSAPQYNPQGGPSSAPQYNPQGGYTSWSQYNPSAAQAPAQAAAAGTKAAGAGIASGLGIKIAAGVLAVALVGGGIAGGIHYRNMKAAEQQAAEDAAAAEEDTAGLTDEEAETPAEESAQQEAEAEVTADWHTLYAEYADRLEERNEEYLTNSHLLGDDDMYTESYWVYLNNDDIPELVCLGGSSADGTDLIYIQNGEVKCETLYYGLPVFQEKKGYFYTSYAQMGYTGTAYYYMDDSGAISQVSSSSCAEDSESGVKSECVWNDESVSAEEYDSLCEETFGALLDSNTGYDESIAENAAGLIDYLRAQATGTEASGEETAAVDWGTLYADYLDNSVEDNYYQSRLIYLNNDDVPELLCIGESNADGTDLYYIQDGEAKKLDMYFSEPLYQEKTGYLLMQCDRQGGHFDEYYHLADDGSVTVEANGSYMSDENFEPVSNCTWDGSSVSLSDYSGEPWHGEDVSASEYKSLFQEACGWLTEDATEWGDSVAESKSELIEYLRAQAGTTDQTDEDSDAALIDEYESDWDGDYSVNLLMQKTSDSTYAVELSVSDLDGEESYDLNATGTLDGKEVKVEGTFQEYEGTDSYPASVSIRWESEDEVTLTFKKGVSTYISAGETRTLETISFEE